LEYKRKEILLDVGKKKKIQTLKQGDNKPDVSTIDKTEKHDTRKIIAENLGWSTGKVAMAEVVNKKYFRTIFKSMEYTRKHCK
jgi:hypothetical protein